MNTKSPAPPSRSAVWATVLAVPTLVLLLFFATDVVSSALAKTSTFATNPEGLTVVSVAMMFGLLLLGGWAGGRLTGVRPFQAGDRPMVALALGMVMAIAAVMLGHAGVGTSTSSPVPAVMRQAIWIACMPPPVT